MSTPYIPISCSYYDRLEAWAVRREEVRVHYKTSEGEGHEMVRGVIVDLFSKEQVEFLKLESGKTIRLDHLISVNNIPLPSDPSCNV